MFDSCFGEDTCTISITASKTERKPTAAARGTSRSIPHIIRAGFWSGMSVPSASTFDLNLALHVLTG